MSINTEANKINDSNTGDSRGKLFVVGTGPGGLEQITPAASKAIELSTTIVGYKRYIDLIEDLVTGKNLVVSAMSEEVARCKRAIELAKNGEVVSIISSGDPGVYGMAGLILELNEYGIDVEVIPGISSVTAAAALVGAPLMHDFAVISLSDLMTPWELIERRLKAASEADFVIALYNPKSKKRTEHILKARDIMKSFKDKTTPVAIVTNANRDGQTIVVTTLDEFTKEDIGMLSIVIIGNSETYISGNAQIITPRGYKEKYSESF